MSRIGKKPVIIPKEISVTITQGKLSLKNSKDELIVDIHPKISIKFQDDKILVEKKGSDDKLSRSLHGLTQRLISNAVEGLTKGYTKKLEIKGVGYRAILQGSKLVLNVGYSHPVEIDAPKGIDFKVQKNIIEVSGIDKQLVGEIAAQIRQVRPPEPYKGKGIKYIDEVVRRKAGKAAKAAAGGTA